MGGLDWIIDTLAEVARKMGSGEGFWITFGSYMAMLLIERAAYLFEHRGRPWNEREARANVLNSSLTLVGEAILFGGLFIGAYVLLYEHARLATVPFVWWGWALAFLLNDLAYYVDHRIAHRTGLFWAIHTTHHSSGEMNLLVANRGTLLGLGGLMSPAYFALPLLGVHPAMFLAVKFFGNLWGIFNHTRLVHRMGVLDRWLCTPANHRVHHGTEPKYLDRNYGQTLLIWDRLFGSWQPEEEEPTYGLVAPMPGDRIADIQTWGLQQLVAKMRGAPTWRNRIRYLWKPPGWSHDGNHQTTAELQAGAVPVLPTGHPAPLGSVPSRG
jgi:sterol desaturase/sphingolipid hydroxylase (fatty acid hydroxylase superfamily)